MLSSGVALRHVMAAVAAAYTGSFLLMDCNPSLYWYDRYLQVTASSISPPRRQAAINGDVISSSSSSRCRTGYHNFQHVQCVWIVGASSGIGANMAEQLAVAGVQHLILSSRSAAACDAVAVRCRHLNPNVDVTVLPVNVTDTGALERAVDAISCLRLSDAGAGGVPTTLDMVVMNAGVGQLLPALETDAATTEQILRSNALWPMLLTPLLFAKPTATTTSSSDGQPLPSSPLPHLVITSSIAGKLAVPLSAAYAASKFAVQGYFSSLAAERPDVRIDLLCPGPVDTEFHRNTDNSNKNDDADKSLAAPLSKMKMPVDRCVALMLSAMQRGQRPEPSRLRLPHLLQPLAFQELWIAGQPSLTALYIQQWFPGLQRRILAIVGPKRVQLWREGLDLYDPASWRRRPSKTSTSASNVNGDSNVDGNNAKAAAVDNVNNNNNNKDPKTRTKDYAVTKWLTRTGVTWMAGYELVMHQLKTLVRRWLKRENNKDQKKDE
jgi:short-subunit dehydrogenase